VPKEQREQSGKGRKTEGAVEKGRFEVIGGDAKDHIIEKEKEQRAKALRCQRSIG
jgi:hypothetical protein